MTFLRWLLDGIRRKFYSGEDKNYPIEMQFSFRQYFAAFIDFYGANKIRAGELPLTHFLGSFDYSVKRSGDRIKIVIHNRSDLVSGTYFPGVFTPPGQGNYPLTLQEVIEKDKSLGNTPAVTLITGYIDPTGGHIVAILRPLTRDETGQGIGGGIFEQTFTWTENDLSCYIDSIGWPRYFNRLDGRP